jgi:hypothetical protein
MTSAGGPSRTTTSSTPRSGHLTRASTRRSRRTRAPRTGSSLVVPDAGAGRPRRPRRALGTEHAPRPPHLRDRAAARRRSAGRLTGAEAQRPVHDLGIYGHQDQHDLERAMDAVADARKAEVPRAGGTIHPPGSTDPAVCRSDGGGGNRTRVRDRTGQSVYRLSLRFRFARTAGAQAAYRRASHPLASRFGRWLSLGAEPVR